MRSFLLRFVLLLAASYGLLYFSYKFYQPAFVQHRDFLGSYYWMFQNPLDFTQAAAPFIYRQISALLTYALFAAGIYYPSETAFADAAYDPRIFFAALATNYLGLVSAAALAGEIVKRETGGFVFPLLAGLLTVLSFHVQSVVITGLTEGITWLFVAALYLLYARESRVAFAGLLVLAIFQRELIPVVFGLIAGAAFVIGHGSRRYNLFVLATAIACFALYLVMRFAVIGVTGQEAQLMPFIAPMLEGAITWDLVVPVLVSQNVMMIAITVGAARWLKQGRVPRELFVLLIACAVLGVLGLGSNMGTNIGRLVGVLTPVFAALIARDLFRLEVRRVGSGE
jgi:hypothetical protein